MPLHTQAVLGVMINDADVEAANVDATNGIVHVIDEVLLPSEPAQ